MEIYYLISFIKSSPSVSQQSSGGDDWTQKETATVEKRLLIIIALVVNAKLPFMTYNDDIIVFIL